MSKQKVESITQSQARTLRMICQILDSTGLPPPVKELAEALGIRSRQEAFQRGDGSPG